VADFDRQLLTGDGLRDSQLTETGLSIGTAAT
jgi:hypothetical protein